MLRLVFHQAQPQQEAKQIHSLRRALGENTQRGNKA
jgi:hypothetical protein